MMKSEDTPLMQQWREVKARHADALVFFRVGDFYELFNEDAEEGARLLDLTLTSRNNGSSRAPLAGVPAQALNTYLQRLIALGRRVAICDQVESPAEAKGIVRREVTETVTPGTIFSDALLDARSNNYLAALAGDPGSTDDLGIALADLSTGELTLLTVSWEDLRDALVRAEPAELLLPRSWESLPLEWVDGVLLTFRGDAHFDVSMARATLQRRFGVFSLEGFGLSEDHLRPVAACGALLSYIDEVQPGGATHLRPPRLEHRGDTMPLDEMTRRNLELIEPLRGNEKNATLLGVIDQAITPMGARLLRRWLLAPLLDVHAIQQRHDAVTELVERWQALTEVRRVLGRIRDLERLATKAATGRASPRELIALADSLDHVPCLSEGVKPFTGRLIRQHADALDPLQDVREEVRRGIDPEAPAQLADGGYIRHGYDASLDELRAVHADAVDWIARLQASERQRTGIGSLRVGFNKVFGYYIEVTRTHQSRVPENYLRKQTLANAERFITPELKEWEETVLGAEERIKALESRLLSDLRNRVAREVPRIQDLSVQVATLDVLCAFAEVGRVRGYVRPEVDTGFALEIRGGRHPVVETMMPREEFIPNDIGLEPSGRVMILSGPNMAGKSTVLRQVGHIVLLAQVGAFVPAESARIGLVDRIFTRVGASDNLVRGQSTFMVEMSETAAILHGATSRSLVLLDEIGRGTSTWDGLSVATAATEYIHDRIGAKTIFATHFHELTRLADRLPGVVNFNVAVREEDDRIVFLRRLVPGGADRSYGVEVARLAGLPNEVVARARDLLRRLELEAGSRPPGQPSRAPVDPQLTMFPPASHVVLERLCGLDVNRLTPIEALNALAELAEVARASSSD